MKFQVSPMKPSIKEREMEGKMTFLFTLLLDGGDYVILSSYEL